MAGNRIYVILRAVIILFHTWKPLERENPVHPVPVITAATRHLLWTPLTPDDEEKRKREVSGETKGVTSPCSG